MKKRLFVYLIFSILLFASVSSAEYFRDIVLTGTAGPWTDSRSYTSITAAIAGIGATDCDLYIARQEACVALTVPANVRLHFLKSGSIANTGQLIINTKNIYARDRQIFTGTGDIDFAAGSVVRSTWFADIADAIDYTNDDSVALIIAAADTVISDCAVGNNVTLTWETAGNMITVAGAMTLSNITQINAGQYQLFAGAGDFDFLDGTRLNLAWFADFADANARIEAEEAVLIIAGNHAVATSPTTTANITLDFLTADGMLTVAGAQTLTISSPYQVVAGDGQQIFAGAGTIMFTATGNVQVNWFDVDGVNDYVQVQAAIDSLGVMAGFVTVLPPVNFNTGQITNDQNVTIWDQSNPVHVAVFGSTHGEFRLAKPRIAGGGIIDTALILHSATDDGRIEPVILAGFGSRTDDRTATWIFAPMGRNVRGNNFQSHDLAFQSGQGTYYNTGTCTATNGSATVIGAGTTWAATMEKGIFAIDGGTYTGMILDVVSTTEITLESAWAGPNSGAGANYYITGGDSTYRAMFTLGQNGVWLINGACGGAGDYLDSDPVAVATAGYTMIINSYRAKSNSCSANTKVRLDNYSGAGGVTAIEFAATSYAGTPVKTLYHNRATDELIIDDDYTAGSWFAKIGNYGLTAVKLGMSDQYIAAAGAITPDWRLGGHISYAMTNDITVGLPAAQPTDGDILIFTFCQPVGGGKTVTFHANYHIAGGAYTLTAGSALKDTMMFIHAGGNIYYELSRAQDIK